jgi:hypothetical protein
MKKKKPGMFSFPSTVKRGTASFSVPGMISKEEVATFYDRLNKRKELETINDNEDEEDEVTHTKFFGENINRVAKAFRKK